MLLRLQNILIMKLTFLKENNIAKCFLDYKKKKEPRNNTQSLNKQQKSDKVLHFRNDITQYEFKMSVEILPIQRKNLSLICINRDDT